MTNANDAQAWVESLSPAEKDRVILFFCEQMQSHSPKMNGMCGYRLRNGWPMTHAIGRTVGGAITAAMFERARGARLGYP